MFYAGSLHLRTESTFVGPSPTYGSSASYTSLFTNDASRSGRGASTWSETVSCPDRESRRVGKKATALLSLELRAALSTEDGGWAVDLVAPRTPAGRSARGGRQQHYRNDYDNAEYVAGARELEADEFGQGHVRAPCETKRRALRGRLKSLHRPGGTAAGKANRAHDQSENRTPKLLRSASTRPRCSPAIRSAGHRAWYTPHASPHHNELINTPRLRALGSALLGTLIV